MTSETSNQPLREILFSDWRLFLPTLVSQAKARIVIVTALCVYVVALLSYADRTHQQSALILNIGLVALGYLAVSMLWLAYIGRRPLPVSESATRIIITAFADALATGYVIAIAGEDLLPLYFVYMWIIMGNGIRFGTDAMTAATCASILSLTIGSTYSEHWTLPGSTTVIFILGLLLIDVFFRRLLAQIALKEKTITQLGAELRVLRNEDPHSSSIVPRHTFLDALDCRLSDILDGEIIVAIVIHFKALPGRDEAIVGDALTVKIIDALTGELRTSDLATLGEANEAWLMIQPRRLADARSVAMRISAVVERFVDVESANLGLASFPASPTDAYGLIRAAQSQIAAAISIDAPHSAEDSAVISFADAAARKQAPHPEPPPST